ncbi:hypothetical protein KM043_007867 [Ampulex compressa]|nr:hypothetical protein KM043_007867 [Ampulex compressa]
MYPTFNTNHKPLSKSPKRHSNDLMEPSLVSQVHDAKPIIRRSITSKVIEQSLAAISLLSSTIWNYRPVRFASVPLPVVQTFQAAHCEYYFPKDLDRFSGYLGLHLGRKAGKSLYLIDALSN